MSHEYKNPDSWIKTIDAEVFRNMDYRFRVWQDPCDAYVNIRFRETDRWMVKHPGKPLTDAPLFPTEVLLHYAYIREIAPVPPKEGYVWKSGNFYNHAGIFCCLEMAVHNGFVYVLWFNETERYECIVPVPVFYAILKEISNVRAACRKLRQETENSRNWKYTLFYDRKMIWLEFDDKKNVRINQEYSKTYTADGKTYSLNELSTLAGLGGFGTSEMTNVEELEDGWVRFTNTEMYSSGVCLPQRVFHQIAQDWKDATLRQQYPDYAAREVAKVRKLKKEWRKIQLSGKMWPMP